MVSAFAVCILANRRALIFGACRGIYFFKQYGGQYGISPLIPPGGVLVVLIHAVSAVTSTSKSKALPESRMQFSVLKNAFLQNGIAVQINMKNKHRIYKQQDNTPATNIVKSKVRNLNKKGDEQRTEQFERTITTCTKYIKTRYETRRIQIPGLYIHT